MLNLRRSLVIGLAIAAVAALLPSLAIGRPQDEEPKAQVSVLPGTNKVKPGQTFPVAVVIDLETNWHINTNSPVVPKELGESEDFIPTTISASPTADGRLVPTPSATQWPKPVMVTASYGGAPAEYGVFEGRVIAYLPVTVPANATTGLSELSIDVGYQACNDRVCLAPTRSTHRISVVVDPSAAGWPTEKLYPEYFTGVDASKLPAASAEVSSPAAASEGGSGISALTLSMIVAGAALVAALVGFILVKKVL
ncbi:MAG: hypothetical protein JNM94_00245 [Phycisphaerae bacterium]|nr:hypothetical protein [Phycisphaerae bacterium]